MKNFLEKISEVNKNTKTSQKIIDFVFGALISLSLYFVCYVFFMGFTHGNNSGMYLL
jgi:ABC-type multidrug transport system permease subunit